MAKDLTDDELIACLKKYQIPHGPIVGSTRKLYEKKINKYEKKHGQRHPVQSGSATCTGSTLGKFTGGMADDELLAHLRKYKIPHGPIVASTRKLYENKINEYEKRQEYGKQSAARSSAACPASTRKLYENKINEYEKRQEYGKQSAARSSAACPGTN
ncbi:lamina-associated polypeptide 2-like [Varanus komodoensis]|uniref:lamina-associated polypeptide 2-like n=1 Tax=Varanus komodoensis TaxID=61221 RepID=UPI001CF7DB54|nr:lamina-associated polypeptide 2-like [Varanus komodoensis]